MKIVLFACSQQVIVDVSTNSMSLINVMEDQISEGFPMLIPQTCAVAVARREGGDPELVEARLQGYLDEQLILDAPLSFNLSGSGGARSIAQLQQLVIPHPATLRFVLRADNKKLGSWETRIDGKPQVEARPRYVVNAAAPPKKGAQKRSPSAAKPKATT
ncbi:MAG: hypothetical protein ACK5V0_12940 [Alphaproteobacteria bacterium]|jgi:hypothetical protein